MSMSYGIDYSCGQSNVDYKTGIHYGVIPVDCLGEYAWDGFEPDYGEACCPKCGNPAVAYNDDDHSEYDFSRVCDYACDSCKWVFSSDDAFPEDALGHYLDTTDLKCTVDSHNDCFVLQSPYYTHAQYCSPCAPSACYLLNPTDKQGPKAYCLGHDWFDGGKAPYPIWRVDTGELVKPE